MTQIPGLKIRVCVCVCVCVWGVVGTWKEKLCLLKVAFVVAVAAAGAEGTL